MILAVLISVFSLAFGSPTIGPSILGPGRIIGGEVSVPNAWAWQLSLEFLGSHTCGAVLIHEHFCLTAAHCVEGRAQNSFGVWAGLHDRSQKFTDPLAQHIDVQKVIEHEMYNNDPINDATFPWDIAILRFHGDLEVGEDAWDNGVFPIRHAGEPDEPMLGRECYITGWGRSSSAPCCENLLREARAHVITEELCQQEMDRCNCQAVVDDTMICLWDAINQDSASCNGDSGGPLSCYMDEFEGEEWEFGQWTVAGITSWGISGGGSCLTTYPSVYTRVSPYWDWIVKKVGKELEYPFTTPEPEIRE